jgi:hypothetical protein
VYTVQCFGEEYSVRLSPCERNRTDPFADRIPLFQGHPDCVVDWVKYRDGLLVTEIALGAGVSTVADKAGTRRAKNMSMATCLLLSWKLLMYALDTLLVASERTPS